MRLAYTTAARNGLDTTCFDLPEWEASGQEALRPPAPVAQRPNWLPAVPTVCLARHQPAALLRGWRLANAQRLIDDFTPHDIIGAVVRIPRGRTSPIAAIDPATRRVRTASGSVYQLGTPDPLFCRAYPAALQSLGF